MPVVYVAIDFNIMSLVQTSMEVQKDKIRPRPAVLLVCKMCARIWSPFDNKSVCDWSYVGTHQWRRYPSDNELKIWAYAVNLIRISRKRKREENE